MANWDSAVSDLRQQLSDGPTDKYCWRKPVFPNPNGKNVTFKTFDYRRATDFRQAVSPLGVYINGNLLPTSAIVLDGIDTGDFTLAVPPQDGDTIETTYYDQWFIDDELTTFLTSASNWLTLGADFTSIPGGLQPSAKAYATSEAYKKLAIKYSQRTSETYRVEDAMDPKTQQAIGSFQSMATAFRKEAKDLRDEYYTRSGQSLQPLNVSIAGRVKSTTPVT
jgi:hypothetical protein